MNIIYAIVSFVMMTTLHMTEANLCAPLDSHMHPVITVCHTKTQTDCLWVQGKAWWK